MSLLVSYIKRGGLISFLILPFCIFAAISIINDSILSAVAHLLGVGRGVDLVLYFLIIFLALYILRIHKLLSEQNDLITVLARKISLSEYENTK
jgi:hypothetical protein